MRIPSGVTDQFIYFKAVDPDDLTTPVTGLSNFTVYRSRNGGAAAAFTTPTINETDATNMPGIYELLLDEDMTIDSGDEEQEMAFHITEDADAMHPVDRIITIFRVKITAGVTLSVESDGMAHADLKEWKGTAPDDLDNGHVDVNVAEWLSEAVVAPDTAGIPKVNTEEVAGTSQTAGDLAALIAALNDPTAAAVADAVWDEAKSGHVGSGSFGEEVQAHALSSEVSALNDLSAADVNAEVDTALSDYDGPTKAELDTAVQAFSVRKNAALANFPFVMYDTDGDPATSLTVTCERSIDGAAFAACANADAELSDGVYVIDLDAADLNGDTIIFKFTASGAKTTFVVVTTHAT